MITYQPSLHFKQRLKDFDDHIVVKWVEHTETLEIWSALPNKRPVLEHSYCRNNKARDPKRPMFNWDMEWIVLSQLIRARRWQHMSVADFQDDMLNKQAKFRAQGEAESEAKFEGFMGDPYWHKKRLQEYENNDFGKCTTVWAGATNPEGNKKNDENMES